MHVTSTSGNDTHCRLLSLWIIPACRTGTVLYYMHIFICTLRLLSSPTVDVTCICSVYYDFYSISLFAETVLHVGQIPMLVYIYKVEILSVCPSVTLLTRLWLLTLSHQLPDTVNPSSSSFKFVSRVNAQATFHQKSQPLAQWLNQLTSIQEVVGSNPAGDQIFFRKSIFLHTCFFKSSFWKLCYLAFQARIEMGLERN